MEWYARHAAVEEAQHAEATSSAEGTPAAVASAGAAHAQTSAASAHVTSTSAAELADKLADPVAQTAKIVNEAEHELAVRQDAHSVQHIRARVQPARVPGRSNEYNIDLAHQVRPVHPCAEM